MNIETGQIKGWDALTEDEKASGKWVELNDGQVRALAQLETERLARQNAGVSVEAIAARIARAEAKRARRRSRNAKGTA